MTDAEKSGIGTICDLRSGFNIAMKDLMAGI
jgi:hypothetical protein